MIRVTLRDGRVIGITFRYTRRHGIRYTHCELYLVEKKANEQRPTLTLLGNSTVKCSKDDNFRKEVGRKYALTAAVMNARRVDDEALGKQDRSDIWNGYLNRPRPKSVSKVEGEEVTIH